MIARLAMALGLVLVAFAASANDKVAPSWTGLYGGVQGGLAAGNTQAVPDLFGASFNGNQIPQGVGLDPLVSLVQRGLST